MPRSIPPPRNALVSYFYGKKWDLNTLAGMRLIGDSGAFSAFTQGTTVSVDELGQWVNRWRHVLCWAASLDVLGNAAGTKENWKILVRDHDVPAVPTLHFGVHPSEMDYYVEQGVDFLGLGGAVGVVPKTQMKWTVAAFQYARRNHPHVRFHGWGMVNSHSTRLPFFSVDSSGWSSAYRYGTINLPDPVTRRTIPMRLNGQDAYRRNTARLLWNTYGMDPADVSVSTAETRRNVVELCALVASHKEQQFRRAHRHDLPTAPRWGRLGGPSISGPHIHLAEGHPQHLQMVHDMTGPREPVARAPLADVGGWP